MLPLRVRMCVFRIVAFMSPSKNSLWNVVFFSSCYKLHLNNALHATLLNLKQIYRVYTRARSILGIITRKSQGDKCRMQLYFSITHR